MSASHHIYRCPFLSGRRVLALAFSDTTSNRGRSVLASGQREREKAKRHARTLGRKMLSRPGRAVEVLEAAGET